LYFLNEFIPDPTAYNVFYAYELRGIIDIPALKNAFLCLIKRHESLRTQFILENATPCQKVLTMEDIQFELPVTDLEGASMDVAMSLEKKTVFDLSEAPLIRAKLFKQADGALLLTLCLHHIITDGWSKDILQSELSYYYNQYLGNTETLEPLALHYIDYVVWQQHLLKSNALRSQEAYWKKQLRDLPVLNLPRDYPLRHREYFSGKSKTFIIDPDIVPCLKALSKAHNITLYVILLTVFNVLLRFLCHQDDIVVGSPISGRHHGGMNGVIGFFANMLVLRNKVPNDASFLNLLQTVNTTVHEAFVNQDVPFEALVQKLNPVRVIQSNPLFHVGFAYQQSDTDLFQLQGISIKEIEASSITSKFDFIFFMTETDDQLTGFIEYSDELFKASTIEKFINLFQTILRVIIKYPNMCVRTLWIN
jgi:NRPS condensation-like uncharacterized protein